MNIAILAQMAADGFEDRIAVGSKNGGISYAELWRRAQRGGQWLSDQDVSYLSMVDANSVAVPIMLVAAACANVPFVPVNYRLSAEQLRSILHRIAPMVAVVGTYDPALWDDVEATVVERSRFLELTGEVGEPPSIELDDNDGIAVLLFTSGTSGQPKAAVLRHKHLFSYIVSTVEFMSAGEDEATLISVPPYHIAGIAALLSSVYSGRRIVQLEHFDPESWVSLVQEESVTHAMLVPTMLERILDVLESNATGLPSLQHLSYGGGRMPLPTIERTMRLLPQASFVNAYGLTETSSTVAILTPEDHREAFGSSDPDVRGRLASVGKPISTLEVEIRDGNGNVLPAKTSGEIYVRGDQIAGEYLETGSVLNDGWFPTNDGGYLDEEGYLFLDGRLDDVIVRGGENISPGEVEDALLRHQAVAEACVFGVPDPEWGEAVAAAVVLRDGTSASEDDLRTWVRNALRSSRTPQRIEFVASLPYTDTGKLLRRVVRSQFTSDTPVDLAPGSAEHGED